MSELEFLLAAYGKAVFEKDQEAFLSLFDENVRIFDMWGRWSYDGLAAWREMVGGWFSSLGALRDRLTFEAVEFLSGGDLASITAIARFAAVSPEGEELRFLHNRITLVVRRQSGYWKIVHQHTSAPVDGETLKAILQQG
jgi:ketosteroid isomerase-like protein